MSVFVRGLRTLRALGAIAALLSPASANAQPGAVVPPARLAILQAEERRAPTPADLITLRTGIRSRDPLAAILAIRAVGRLERPALIVDLLPALQFALPEVRAEAANAIGQAARGWNAVTKVPAATDIAAVQATLIGRLTDEEEASVRAALAETIGRLPYEAPELVARAETALIELAESTQLVTDRLGVTKGFEALVRRHRDRSPSPAAITTLRALASIEEDGATTGQVDHRRDARVRRLSLEALIAASAVDDDLIVATAADPDPQVRRLSMRAAATSGKGTGVLARGLEDAAAMVRLEALRGFAPRRDDGACDTFIATARDVETTIALVAIDQLSVCAGHVAAARFLEATVNDLSNAGSARGWHRAAHAIVALAAMAPSQGAAALGQFVSSTRWQLRVYAARAAAVLQHREVLETLAADPHDNVVEAAIEGLAKVARHDGDGLYIRALSRTGYQAIRAAAAALDETPKTDDAVPALRAAWTRLVDEDRANSADTRAVLAATLTRLGAPPPAAKPARPSTTQTVLSVAELRRLAAPRARITIRDLGSFDIALFTSEAPLTVLRFAALADARYYDGLTFHRVVPNFVVQGGSPAANEYVGISEFMRDEVGLWPHVRGSVGISTRGRDTGDAQFFVDLVDNPRFDHRVHGLCANPERPRGRRADTRGRRDRDDRDPPVKWSRRVEGDLTANALTTTVRAMAAEGRPVIDLTLSNPTSAGLEYPPDLLDPLAAPRGLVYHPEPFGLAEARQAVAADCLRRGIRVPDERIVLTASTSEAYSLLFKVLCDPGDVVLVPRPGYPLLDHLTRLDAVVSRAYDLEYHGSWSIDFDSIERAWSPGTRAVVTVSPNNPTGSRIKRHELERLAALCAARGAALIADEVFVDYPLAPDVDRAAGVPAQCDTCLSFSLGGLSKSIGLPQIKLAWIIAAGPAAIVRDALSRLELAADTYLSVSTPVQVAARELLERGAVVREQIRVRVTSNYRYLVGAAVADSGCAVLHADGGWYAVLRVPAVAAEEELVLALLERDGVLTHPGYFFDFRTEAFLIVSLLPPDEAFRAGVTRIVRHFACRMDCK